MALTINTNTRSINANRQLRQGNQVLNKVFQQLSSGLRINQAADDAAGLAISSRFTSQIRGLNQAVRNASDGVSLVQTADSALASTGENLQRIRELSIQAANGTLTDADRQAIQSEVDQLTEEIGRVADTTTFNGQRVLDGSFQRASFQVGANANETIGVPGADTRTERLGAAAVATSGAIDPSGLQAGELTINGVDVRATQATDDTLSTANNTGSAIAVAAAINDVSEDTGVTATVNATEVEGGAVGGGQLDSNNQLIINGESISGFAVQSDDAGGGLVDAINAVADRTGVTASRTADGTVALTAQDGRNIDVQTTGNADTITGLAAGTTTGTVTLTSDEQFTIGGASPGDAGLQAGIEGVRTSEAVASVDVSTVQGANRSLSVIDRALGQVSAQRSTFGALQNRFESTINNLTNVSENLAAANSRIRDADFAERSSQLVQRQIIQQANIAVLSQANVSQQSALTLLNG
jgi:flagellin